MKREIITIAMLGVICTSAQGTILMGKISDKAGNVIDPIRVTVANGNQTSVAWLKGNGTYYTDDIAAGQYNISIVHKGRTYSGSVNVPAPDAGDGSRFCNLVVSDGGIVAQYTTEDPFMTAELERVKRSDNRVDWPIDRQEREGNELAPQPNAKYLPANDSTERRQLRYEPPYFDKVKQRKR